CNGGTFSNGGLTCNHTTGMCEQGTSVSCDDGNVCTTDTCNEMTHHCDHVGVGGCCQQDSDCSTVCNPGGTCDTGTGVCQAGAPLNCDDHDACTTDSCDPMSGCVHDSVDCNSHSPCIMDSCDPMSGCVHTSITGCCTADGDCPQDFCTTGVQTCMDNTCQPPGMPADCDDSNPCTDHSDHQRGADHNDKQRGADHDDKQRGADDDDEQRGADHDDKQRGADDDDEQRSADHDDVQRGADHDDEQRSADHDDVQRGADHDDVQR